MAFKKGAPSPNPNGRPKGRSKKPIKTRIENLLDKNFDKIEEEMDNASPEDRRDFFTDLAGLVLTANKQLA